MTLYLGSGDPNIFNAWWFDHRHIELLPSLRYQVDFFKYQEERQHPLAELIKTFRRRVRGDSTPDPRFTVFGSGSTQVLHAILLTLALKESRRPLRVGMVAPYYMLMRDLIEMTPGLAFTVDPEEMDVEIVVSPNNPTGNRATPVSRAKYIIYDHAYDWPTYTPVLSDDTQEAISVFTASKLFGVAGLRLGWAHFADEALGRSVERALDLMSICPNSFALATLSAILNLMLTNELYREFFEVHRQLIQQRRAQISRYVTVLNEHGPYAWIYHPENAVQSLAARGIEVRPGSLFGATDQYARCSLIDEPELYLELEKRLASPR